MSGNSRILGPATLSIFLHFIDDKGQTCKVEYSAAPGRLPTEADLHKAIGASQAAVPAEFRLMDGGEFLNLVVIKEKFGKTGNFAAPDSFLYDVEALAAAARSAYEPTEDDDGGGDHAEAGLDDLEDPEDDDDLLDLDEFGDDD